MAFICKTIEWVQYFGAPAETIEFAKLLRRRLTPAEKLIWQRLKGKNIKGMKFRRQQPIGHYIADFYCHEIRLVIEIDGPIHLNKERSLYDKSRTAEMNRYDIKVIRFTNDEVRNHIGMVMNTIREEILNRKKNAL
ncbi:MAG: endonuclease domain-containing protein [Bacteroidetes bacterium]|nr:endonuclease domain-containing protein [Bacteroidota bacterium]